MSLVLNLLGTVQATYNGVPRKFATDHTRALLIYLVLEADVAHPRTSLATLLWPEENETTARHNLRQALFFLKQALGPGHDQFLHVTPSALQWQSKEVAVDLQRFQQLCRLCQSHNHASLQNCVPCIQRLTEAVALYQGEFLAGFLLKESQPFEEWALFLREQTHRQVLDMLTTLTAHCLARGDYAQAQHYATRQVALEPWLEDGHRQLMQALAAQGQQSAALRQYENCRRTLQAELGVSPALQTTQLYEQIRAGQRLPASPAPQEQTTSDKPVPPRRLHNLPIQLTPMVGRNEQLEQLRRLVCDPGQRLVTLVGMGGMGKTRLALALLEHLVTETPAPFPDGVWFVPLVSVAATVADLPAALVSATINALGMINPNQTDPQAALFYHLAERHLLLVWDNVEQILAEDLPATAVIDFLNALLRAAPGITLLLTSRVPVQMLAERIVRLEGLPVPAVPTGTGLQGEAANYASVQLFAQHAQRTLPSFALDTENLPLVVEVCSLLSGIPLALELAAALTPHFTLPELVAAIRQNLAILISTRRDMDVRHRRFSAILESSWQLLSPDEARVLTQSAIFVGNFSRAAVQAVIGATPLELTGLLDKSLLQQSEVGVYRLHELLRHFAAQQLATLESQQIAALQQRYVAYYLGLITDCNPRLRQRGAQATIVQLRQVSENCQRAWQLALEQRWLEPLDAVIDGWLRYWEITGGYRSGETLLADALALLEPSTLAAQRLLAKLWLAYARCLYGQERVKESLAATEQACQLALAGAEATTYALGQALLAKGLSLQNRHAETRPFAERAYQSGVWEAQVDALITMANFAESVEEHVAITAQALQLAQQHDDPYLILLCMKEMAGSYENEGYYADSLPCRAQALQLAYEIQDAYQIGEAHYLHGLIHAHVGLFETAIEHFQRALALAQAHNVIWLERRTLNRLARSHYCLGQLDTAHAFSLQMQKICRPGDELPSFFDFTYAQILAAFNRWAEAERAYQQILTRKRGDKMTAATILLPELAALAQLALQQGKFQHALGYVEEILAIERSHPQRFMPNLYFDAYAIDVACYKVLHALHDWRAPSLLAASYQHLCSRVEQIADQRLRHAYLENVAANRALHEAYVHTLSIEEQARAAVIVGR